MRKLTAILLLASLYFTFSGYHFLFRYRISRAKTEMRSYLRSHKDHKDVVEFSFSHKEAEQLDWEDGHEFRYHGKMYDVVEEKKEGEKIIIHCISDEKETDLLKDYQRKQDHNRTTASILQLMTAAFLPSSQCGIEPPQKEIKNTYFDRGTNICTLSLSLFIPPPDVC